MRSDGQMILLNSGHARDPAVQALLDEFRPRMIQLMDNVIGSTKVELEVSHCRSGECNIGNLIADAFLHARVLRHNGKYWTDASIGFIQGGGVRASIRTGNITEFDLRQVLPFKDRLILVQVPAIILKLALEQSVARYTGDRGEFLQLAGIKVVYDLAKPPGNRVQSVRIRCADCDVPRFEILNPNKTYGVVLAWFLYSGGDGYAMFNVRPMYNMLFVSRIPYTYCVHASF